MAILKHFAVKNADYGAVIDYLKYQHDEFHLVPILDENGNSMLRDEFYFDGLNCNPEAFDLECELLNQQYHKNQRYDEIKCHHYIISHDPMDVADHGLTGEQAQAIGMEYAKANFPGHQALVCTHTDGSNNSGNIHTHIIINSLRKEDIASQPYTERAIDCKAGYKHHLTKEYLRHLQSSLMDICQREGLYQVDLQPIFGGKGGNLKEVLAAEAGVKAEDILDADLVLATREKAVRMGLNGEYFMSGRIDDLECAYTTLWGFLQGRGEEEGRGDIWVMFDNEEVGSSSRQGAQGTLMADVLARIEESLGVSREQSIRARTNSLVLSADNGHATHPNHPEKSDPANPVVMGGGVLLKYNARQTYTTSGFTGAAFTAICKKAGVPVQVFANRADVPGGSTLGNLLGHQILMPMVDIGLGQLAMHSAMETASCADAEYMAKAVAEYYNTPIFQPKDGEWKLGL